MSSSVCLVERQEPLHLSLPTHFWFRRQISHTLHSFMSQNAGPGPVFWKTQIQRRLWRWTDPPPPGIKHVMQFLPLGSNFLDKRNILDEVLLISKGECFAFTVSALWFEAEISHYFLASGHASRSSFSLPKSLEWCSSPKKDRKKSPQGRRTNP